jgi:threonine/homoserine/homoserine lactone efflux protein
MIIHDFWVFVLAALVLNLTPGNDMIYVITRSTSQGVKAGIISSLGIMAGCMVHILAAVIGLSALIAKSATAFGIIKYAGAAYLIYLGVRSLTSKRKSFETNSATHSISYKKLFWQGALTNTLNPKVALFFLAFLPQFINMHATQVHWQILFLGTWFNISGTLVNIAVAILFGKIGHWLSNSPRFVLWQERITGVVLVGLGIKVALSSKN